MEVVRASAVWAGHDADVLRIFREPTPDLWEADPIDEGSEFMVLRTLNEQEEETGEVAGFELIGALDFERWQDLPQLPLLWQLPGWEPLPLATLLQRKQQELRRTNRRHVRSA